MFDLRQLARPVARLGATDALRRLLQRHAPALARPISHFHRQPDRRLLETIILVELARDPLIQRVLFVGCDWYTQHYARLFRDKVYWTLDIDPEKRRFGADRHLTDRLINLQSHFPPDHFDAIVCNGVFMRTAMDTREEAEPSFDACLACLKPGSWFVLGWNDTDALRPYPPAESPALQKFARAEFPGIGTHEVLTPTEYRHTYTFYRRPI